jgi:protein-L-isoaspartate(D-aspartate) O-methyltransferase
MSEAHFAILRRHMVEVIGIQVDIASEELGKAALDERVLAAMRKVPRHRFRSESSIAEAAASRSSACAVRIFSN